MHHEGHGICPWLRWNFGPIFQQPRARQMTCAAAPGGEEKEMIYSKILGTLFPSKSSENEGLRLWWVIAWRTVFGVSISMCFSLLRFAPVSMPFYCNTFIQNPSRLTKHSMLQLRWRTSHWDANAAAPFCPHRRNRVEHAPACCAAHLFQEMFNRSHGQKMTKTFKTANHQDISSWFRSINIKQ